MCIVHSFIPSLSYDRYIANSTASFAHRAIKCFLLQFSISSRLSKAILYTLTSSSPTSHHLYFYLYISFNHTLRWQFLRKTWPVHLVFLLCIALWMPFSSLTLCNSSSFPTRSSNWSSPFISSTTFKNFPGISDLLSSIQVQAPYNIFFPNRALISRFLKSKSNFVMKRVFFLLEFNFCRGNPGFNFICSSLHHSLWCCPNSWRIQDSLAVFDSP